MNEIKEGCPKKNGLNQGPLTPPPAPPKPQGRREGICSDFDAGMSYHNNQMMRQYIDSLPRN
jgi:hypothetical protein